MSEERLARIETKLDALTVTVADRIEFDNKRYDRHARIIYGENGSGDKPGLLVRLDRIEQNSKRHAWLMRVIVGTVVALAAGGLWSLISS